MSQPAETGDRTDEAPDRMFRSLGRKKAYEEVSDEIRRLILSRTLQSSDRLPTERDLAEQFGVSRTAVREAIRILERSGLLTVKKGPRGGIFVAQQYERPISDSIVNLLAVGEANLENLVEMRLMIEPHAASRAAELATESELEQLNTLLSQAEGVQTVPSELRPLNIEFHRAILRVCRNPVMAVMGDAVLGILSDRIKGLISPRNSQRALCMHRDIMDALRRRQSTRARDLMEEDIQATGRRLANISPEELLAAARQGV